MYGVEPAPSFRGVLQLWFPGLAGIFVEVFVRWGLKKRNLFIYQRTGVTYAKASVTESSDTLWAGLGSALPAEALAQAGEGCAAWTKCVAVQKRSNSIGITL